MTTTREQHLERATAGFAALNSKRGLGWQRGINLTTFDITSGSRCVLGQVYGTYSTGLHILQGIGDADMMSCPDSVVCQAWSVDHGFISEHGFTGESSALGDVWRQLITTANESGPLPWYLQTVGRYLKGTLVLLAIPSPYHPNVAWFVGDRGEDFPRDRYLSGHIMPTSALAQEWDWSCYHPDQESATECAYRRALGLTNGEE